MDPGTILAITSLVLEVAKTLASTVKAIADAPDNIRALGEELNDIVNVMTTIRKDMKKEQWEKLGDSVRTLVAEVLGQCQDLCEKAQTDLDHWTRHSDPGTVSSKRDRLTMPIRSGKVKSITSQLAACKATLTSVVGVATLLTLNQQGSAQTEIQTQLGTLNQQLASQNNDLDALKNSMDQLQLEVQTQTTTTTTAVAVNTIDDDPRSSLLEYVTAALASLTAQKEITKKLLEMLLALMANKGNQNTVIFGSNNSGQQFGVVTSPVTLTINNNK